MSKIYNGSSRVLDRRVVLEGGWGGGVGGGHWQITINITGAVYITSGGM